MNRLQAAREIRKTLHHQNADGSFTHIDFNDATKAITTVLDKLGTQIENNWQRRSWLETLRFIRANYPRKTSEECRHNYVIWYEPSQNLNPFHAMRVNCTTPGEHTHCIECNEPAENREGPKWCASCWKDADDKRKEITLAIIDYEDSFGLSFVEDKKTRDQFDGNDDGDCR